MLNNHDVIMPSRGMKFISKRDACPCKYVSDIISYFHAIFLNFHSTLASFQSIPTCFDNFFFFRKHLKKRRTHMHICPWHNFSYATYLYFHISVLWLIYYDVMPHSILCHGWCVSVTWRLWNDSCISAPRLMQLSHAIFLIDLSAMVYVFLCQNSDIFQGHDSCICTQ